MATGLFAENWWVRLSPDRLEAVLGAGEATTFSVMPGREMKGYAVMPATDVADDARVDAGQRGPRLHRLDAPEGAQGAQEVARPPTGWRPRTCRRLSQVPCLKPVLNHLTRWSDEPCVHVLVDRAGGLLLDPVVADGLGGGDGLADVLLGDRLHADWSGVVQTEWAHMPASSRPGARAGSTARSRSPWFAGPGPSSRARPARGGRTHGRSRTLGEVAGAPNRRSARRRTTCRGRPGPGQ